MEPRLQVSFRRGDAIALGGLALLAVVGLALLGWFATHQEVVFVSGLDVPLDVELDGDRFVVSSMEKKSVKLRTGLHTVRVRSASGELLDEGPLDVPAWMDVVTYNPLGAAPIYRASVVYALGAGSNDAGTLTFLGGVRAQAVSHVDFVFKDPPERLQIKSGESSTRTRFDVAPGGWLQTVGYYANEGQYAKAARLVRVVAHAEPDRDFTQLVHVVVLGEGSTAGVAFARELRDRRPDDADAHFSYLSALALDGRAADAQQEYRDRHAKEPDSPLLGVMHARVESAAAGGAILDELLLRFPGDALVRSSAARHALLNGQPARAADLYAALGSEPRYPRWVDDHAHALVALGRASEALSILGRVTPTEPGDDARVALVYGLVKALPGIGTAPPRDAKDARLAAWVRSVLGQPATLSGRDAGDPIEAALQIHSAIARDPAEAARLCAAAPTFALERLHPALAMLLAAELERVGDTELAGRLAIAAVGAPLPWRTLVEYLDRGVEDPELWRLSPESRAALDFVRSRVLAESGEPSAALVEAARKRDVLRGPVTRAIDSWPAVDRPGAPGVVLLKQPTR